MMGSWHGSDINCKKYKVYEKKGNVRFFQKKSWARGEPNPAKTESSTFFVDSYIRTY